MQMIKRVFMIIFIVVVFAALLEAASRLIGRRIFERIVLSRRTIVEDPLLSHVWIPSMKRIDNVRSIPYFLVTNKQSWVEEYDVEREKPDNTYRIFYLGDSSVQGVVDSKYKMVEIVERKLNRIYKDKDIKFEVINTGTSSYSFLQYYLLVKTVLLDYSPDLVVLNIDMTDVVNDAVYRKCVLKNKQGEIVAVPAKICGKYAMTPDGYLKIKGLNLPDWLIKKSDYFYLLSRISRQFFINRNTGHLDRSANWLAETWSDEIVDNVNESMKVLSMTIELLRANNVKVLITGVPVYPQYTGGWSSRPHEALGQVAERERAPYLNSYEALKDKIANTDMTEYFWANDESHFNIKGNKIWADAQLDFLLNPANGLLPFERLR